MRGSDDRLRRALRQKVKAAAMPPARRPQPLRDTWPEAVVADWLARWGLEAEPQHELLPGVRVDFWLPAQRAVIECQGTWHHGDPALGDPRGLAPRPARKRRHDAALGAWCERAQVRLVEVWEADLRADPAAAQLRLRGALGLPTEDHAMGETRRQRRLDGGCELLIRSGDLTSEAVAAIVNAANSHLAHGGGVAGAIVRRGGAVIQAASDAWVREHGPLPTGQAALTTAGALSCDAVIHAVGPVWRGGGQGEPEALASAVRSALALAAANGIESVALPAISSGIFGFPRELCAEVILDAIVAHDMVVAGGLPREVRVTNIDEDTVAVFVAEFDRRWPRL